MQNSKFKSQNHNSKVKTDLKDRTYRYAIKMIEFLDTLPNDMSTGVIARQLMRSATSIGANIIESRSSSSKRDFVNFINHSLKSANESLFWLGLLRNAKKMSDEKLDDLQQETKELANILGSSVLTLRGKRKF